LGCSVVTAFNPRRVKEVVPQVRDVLKEDLSMIQGNEIE
jgi:hypothetical protein